MLRRFVLAATLLILALGLATEAQGATKKTRQLQNVMIKTGSVDGRDGGIVFAGTITGSLGSGAAVNLSKGNGQPNGFSSTGTIFLPNGTLKFKFTNTLVTQPDMTAKVDGKGTITGGTARFKGATGNFTMSGTGGTDGILKIKVSGSVRY